MWFSSQCLVANWCSCLLRREYGPVFSWMLGPTKMTTVVDYDAVKSLLQLGDSKVG